MNNQQPKYAAIRSYLLEQIDSKKLQQGSKLPTERQLCDMFNVSRVTVQSAFSGLQKEGKIYRIRGGGTYVGIAPFAPTSQDRPPFIPFIISNNNPSTRFLEIINGAENYLKSKSCYVTVHSPSGDNEAEKEIIQSLIDKGIKSMMILPFQSDINNSFYFELVQKEIRLVFIDLIPNGLVGNLVSCNNVMGGYLVTDHLLKNGFKRVAVISGSISAAPSVSERITGYRFALEKNGNSVNEDYICVESDINTQDGIIQRIPIILERLLSLPEPPDALFCVNDRTAVDTYNALTKMGFRIPEDIALAGFDNLSIAAGNPVPITTIDQHFYDIGYYAAKLCYESPDLEYRGFTHQFLPVTLIERKSTQKFSRS
ncbi:MAG: GntR family transcriptional regulator [Oscillospiraceae bacterium]|nr:GntR family transcriptional regulator [Oscillospiraceae bacterium]